MARMRPLTEGIKLFTIYNLLKSNKNILKDILPRISINICILTHQIQSISTFYTMETMRKTRIGAGLGPNLSMYPYTEIHPFCPILPNPPPLFSISFILFFVWKNRISPRRQSESISLLKTKENQTKYEMR